MKVVATIYQPTLLDHDDERVKRNFRYKALHRTELHGPVVIATMVVGVADSWYHTSPVNYC